MREREEKKKKVASDDRRARNIPSKQDKSWVIKTYYPRVIFTIRIVCLLKILS